MLPEITPDFILQGLVWLVALILSLTVHEAAHAWMAWRRGDGTAKLQGRLTLDPLAHMDPIGTLLLPVLMYITNIPLFGWARPVPVNIYNLRHPTRDFMFVALAGPVSNVLQAGLWLILFKVFVTAFPAETGAVFYAWHGAYPLVEPGMDLQQALILILGLFLYISILLNLILAIFNMIPIPPLDGSRVLNYFLPPRGQGFLHSIEPFGFLIIMALMWGGILGPVLIEAYGYVLSVVWQFALL